MDLSRATINRELPSPLAVAAVSRIPTTLLREMRLYHTETTDAMIFEALDHIGVEVIEDVISQGAFLYDIARSMDIPTPKFKRWLDARPDILARVVAAEQLSAEYYLSHATDEIMSVQPGDLDHAKTARLKSDYMKWIATKKDSMKYGDKVSHSHSGDGNGVTFNFIMSEGNSVNKVIDVADNRETS